MSLQTTSSIGPRERAYNQNFQKKLGEVVDLAGRALVAAGLGVGVVSELAANKYPHPGVLPMAVAILGFVLIYRGISWQAGAEADKEHLNA